MEGVLKVLRRSRLTKQDARELLNSVKDVVTEDEFSKLAERHGLAHEYNT
jgi:hypothetical protein